MKLAIRPFWEDLAALGLGAEGVPWLARGPLLLAGLALVLLGGRLGRHGARLSVGAASALFVAALLQHSIELPEVGQSRTVPGLLLVGAGLGLWIEALSVRAGLVLSGWVAGALVALAVQVTFGFAPSVWWPFGGALLGGFSVPWVYEAAPRFVSPLLGAPVVAWAVGYPDVLPLLAALWGIGVTLQIFTGPAEIVLAPVVPETTWRRGR